MPRRSTRKAPPVSVVLSRQPQPLPWRVVPWDAETTGPWCGEIDGCDLVVNLTGRSVNCRYQARNRRDILASRRTLTGRR